MSAVSGPTETQEVDPERFEPGRWSAEFNKTVGEGDISASYSGDIIALRDRVRRPFIFRGDLWVNVCQSNDAVRAYRLLPIDEAGDEATTYAEKARDGEASLADPMGFYHGALVRFREDWFVLSEPPARFVPGSVTQPGLFAKM